MSDLDGRSVHPGRRWWWVGGGVVVVAVVVVVVLLATGGGGAPASTGSADSPVVVMTPPAGSLAYRDGQKIQLSVAANKLFNPYSRIVVLECADPGGTVTNLPVNDSTCDGNTVNPYSILVTKDGSFSVPRYHSYQLFVLPNKSLGEVPDGQPVCNATHWCVLYVGQDQTNFKSPKVFSAPFTISGSGTRGSTP